MDGRAMSCSSDEKVDDHCARVSRAVKSNRKGERAHDTQQ